MGFAKKLSTALYEATGVRVSRYEPRGVSLARDIARDLPRLRMATILDVGANIGQSAEEYLREFPHAMVHSIEPASATYNGLVARFRGIGRFKAYQLGMGAEAGEVRLSTEGPSETFHIAAAGEGGTSELIRVQTLDMFIATEAIGSIDFLKIDTEGNDLDVLRGGREALASHAIGLIQVEAGMNPDNDRHISLFEMTRLLEPFGYRIFGIYDQVNEFPTGRANLRRINAVFATPTVIESDRRIGFA